MKIAIINEFSPRVLDYKVLDCLKDVENEVHLFTKERFKEYYTNSSIILHTFENMPVSKAYILDIINSHKEKNFDYIVANHEYDLLIAAKLREFLQIKGQSYKSTVDFRDKYIMKKTLLGKVKIPNFSKINDSVDLVEFIQENGFPVVIKPRLGAGSSGVIIINDLIDLKDNLKIDFSDKKLMVESFVLGDMYHIDGIFKNNTIEEYTISKYYNNCLSYADNEPVGSYIINDFNPDKQSIFEMVDKVLKSLNTPKHGIVFHAELYKNTVGELVFCEIASRVGGGRIASTFNFQTNIDLQKYFVESQIGVQSNIKPNISSSKHGWIIFPPRTGKLISANILNKSWIKEANFDFSNINKNFSGASFNGDALISYVIEGKDEKELFKRMNFIEEFQNANTKYALEGKDNE